jgi:hypothetical protein
MSIIARNLRPFNNDALELMIDTDTGESFAGSSAIARMVSTKDKPVTTWQITSYCETLIKGVKISPPFNSEIDTQGGLQGVKLYNEKAIRECAKKYNPDLFDKLADIGTRVYLHELAGYKVTSTATQKLLSPTEMLLQHVQITVEHERQLAAQDRRLEAIEQRQQEALAKLKQLPPASVEVEPLTTRFALGRLVRDYAIANSIDYPIPWNRLYMEHRDRTHIDLKARARNHKPKMSCCEYAEKYGYIEQLYAIALEIFG